MEQFFRPILHVFVAGGWVMAPLLLLSLISGTLCLERVLFWTSTHGGRRQGWLARITAAFRAGRPTEARRLAEGDATVYGRFIRDLIDLSEQGGGEAAAAEAVERIRPAVERWSTTLSTIITAAPMLGILGTVIGIIQSFRLLGGVDSVVVDPAQVAGGIAQALITTAFGLIIALATLFPYVIFRASADRCFTRLETVIAAAVPTTDQPASKRTDEAQQHKAEAVATG